MKMSLHMTCFLLLLAGMRLTHHVAQSKEVFVDTSITVQTGDSYPTLKEAVQALYDSNTQTLLENNNTITLLSNTGGTTQMFPNLTLSHSAQGQISIVFENPPSELISTADCSLLPQVILSTQSESILALTGLDSFFLHGIYLQVVSDGADQWFTSLRNITFDRFCIELTPGQDQYYPVVLTLHRITNLTMSNFILDCKSTSQIRASSCVWVVFENSKFFTSVVDITLEHPVFALTNELYINQLVHVKNLFTSGPPDFIGARTLVYFDYIAYALLQEVVIQDWKITSGWDGLFSFSHTSKTVVQYLTVKNFHGIYPPNTGSSIISMPYHFNVLFEHFYVYNLVTESQLDSGGFDFMYIRHGQSSSLILRNFTFENVKIYGREGMITILDIDTIPTKSQIEGISIIGSSFLGTSFFFIKTPPFTSRQMITTTFPYSLSNINITGCSFNSSVILAFVNVPLEVTVYTIDMYRVEMTNLCMQNSTFWGFGELNVIEITGAQLRLFDLIMNTNSFEGCAFIIVTLRISSLFFMNSTIENLILINGATFLDYSQQQTSYFQLEPAYYGDGTVLVEERPFMMINCTFNNITLKFESSLILGNNPTIMVINNTFIGINSTSSTVISFGRYRPAVAKAAGAGWALSMEVQDKIFENLQTLQLLFQSLRGLMTAYRYSGSTAFYFVYANNNSFSNLISTDDTSIISISNLQFDSTVVGLFSCSFSDLVISSINSFNLISLSEVYQVILQDTTFVDITGGNYALAISAETIYALQIGSTSFQSIQEIAGYKLRFSICNGITIKQDHAENIQAKSTWIQLYCGLSQRSILFDSSNYENVSMALVSQELLALYFLEVQVEKTSMDTDTQNFIITGANFNNIKVDKSQQGFVQNVFKSPVILLTLSDSAISLADTQFSSITSLPDDNIIGISAVNITILNCSVTNLTFNEISGAIYLIFTNLVINGSVFIDNSRPDDGIGELLDLVSPNVDAIQSITIQGTNFSTNIASVIIVRESTIKFEMKDSILVNNYPHSTGAIILTGIQASSINFRNVVFQYSQLPTQTDYTYIYDILQVGGANSINIGFDNCTLQVKNGFFAGDLMVLKDNQDVTLDVTSLIYHNQSDTSEESLAFGILRADKVNASMSGLDIEGLSLSESSLISLTCPIQGNVNITSSSFTQLNMSTGSSIFSVSDSSVNTKDTCEASLSLEQVVFSNISNRSPSGAGPIFQISTPKLKGFGTRSDILAVNGGSFQDLFNSNKGAVYSGKRLQNNATISFERSTFANINIIKQEPGGGIFYVESGGSTTTIGGAGSINRRILSQADAAYTDYFIVTSSNFSNISAYSGGVYYSIYGNEGNSTLIFNENTFTNISVQDRGAIFYVNDPNVSASGNQFINTSALITGSVIYSIEAQLNFDEFNSSNSFSNLDSAYPISFSPNLLEVEIEPAYPITNVTESSFTLANLTSDSLQSTRFSFALKHVDSQISQSVYDESNSASLTIIFGIPAIGNQKGVFPCTGHGSCTLPTLDFTLAGVAGTVIEVNATYESPRYTHLRRFYIQLRECVPGEINKTVTCERCGHTTYSLDPSDKACSPCPPGADCQGGSDLTVRLGYWRNSSMSANVVPCNDSDTRCLGGGPANCSEGFTGPACMQCDSELGYLAHGPVSCSQCPPKEQVIPLGTFLLLGLLAYQFFTVYSTFKFNKKLHVESQEETGTAPDRTGAYMVILATYSQVSSVISNLNVGYINDLFGISSAAGNPNKKIFFSVGCLYSIINSDPFAILKFKTMLFVVSPAAKVLLALPFLIIRGISKRKEENFKHNLIMKVGMVAVVFIILEQPGIIGALCDYLTCTRLDPYVETRYVSVQASVECGTGEYDSFRYVFVIPALAAWGFAIPLMLLFFLFKNKKHLNSSERLRIVFGGLYSNYTSETYYWGIIIIIFKITMFTLDSILDLSESGKSLVFLMLLHPYYILYKRKRPHLFDDLQRAEKFVILSFIWSLVAVLIKNNYDHYLVSKACDLVMLIANAVGIGYLLYKISFVYLKKVVEVIAKLKEKWANQQKKKIIDVQNSARTKEIETITSKTERSY